MKASVIVVTYNRPVYIEMCLQSLLRQSRIPDPSKQHAAQLRPGILEREIDVPGALAAQVRHLARHPNLAHLLFQQPLDLPRQFGDGEHFAHLFRWEQLTKIPL